MVNRAGQPGVEEHGRRAAGCGERRARSRWSHGARGRPARHGLRACVSAAKLWNTMRARQRAAARTVASQRCRHHNLSWCCVCHNLAGTHGPFRSMLPTGFHSVPPAQLVATPRDHPPPHPHVSSHGRVAAAALLTMLLCPHPPRRPRPLPAPLGEKQARGASSPSNSQKTRAPSEARHATKAATPCSCACACAACARPAASQAAARAHGEKRCVQAPLSKEC